MLSAHYVEWCYGQWCHGECCYAELCYGSWCSGDRGAMVRGCCGEWGCLPGTLKSKMNK